KAFTLIELLVAIAVISHPTALETTVTVSAEGTYVLQLEVNDGEYTSTDTMTINAYLDDWTNATSGE
ncbi:MAG: type II secretion system protein, partial [Planctomycetota bacterium]